MRCASTGKVKNDGGMQKKSKSGLNAFAFTANRERVKEFVPALWRFIQIGSLGTAPGSGIQRINQMATPERKKGCRVRLRGGRLSSVLKSPSPLSSSLLV